MNLDRAIADSLTNLAANLGIGTSKSVHDQFGVCLLNDIELESMYRGEGIARKVVDLPVTDLMRPWRSWQATKEQITTIEDAEKRHKVRAKFKLAMELARLYGGAAIIIGADTGNPGLPLNPGAVRKDGLKYLTVVHRRQLGLYDLNRDPISPFYGEPRSYQISGPTTGSVDIHPSRVIRFIGKPRPDIDTNTDGWGDSILQVVYSALLAAARSHAGIAELIHEAKVDIINMDGLTDALSTDAGTNKVMKRFQAANMLKSINNMLLLDKDDTWDRKQTTFAGLPDVMMAFMQVVAGVTDIPLTRLLGTSAKGLNATGEGDEKNYHQMLDSIREDDLRPKLEFLDEILWRDATGLLPKDVFFNFNPLAQMSDTEKATLAKTKAETAQIYVNLAIMPEEALAGGIVNSLIEDGTYPGLEAAIEEEVGEDGDLIPEDPMGELELERGNAEIRALENAAKGKQAAKDRAAPGAPNGGVRDRLGDDAEWLAQVYTELDARQRAGGRQG